ncbi:hypothetical protein [Enterococcus sp. AZ072]|uniref:hypothetical protein n=1 Tax=unclassified Enterococcus TaxID=2608891 RepID=UPI003D28AE9A
MKRIYRYLTVTFGIITLIISHIMVGKYRELVCQNEHGLTSSPPAMIYIHSIFAIYWNDCSVAHINAVF